VATATEVAKLMKRLQPGDLPPPDDDPDRGRN
jgi:hypothetical protein